MKKEQIFIILSLILFLTACSPSGVTIEGESFFQNHGFFNILGWIFFPRIMFIFFSYMTGGFLFWLGVLAVPRFMIAFWATTYYWDTNPYICVIAWLIAFSGEPTEKKKIISIKY